MHLGKVEAPPPPSPSHSSILCVLIKILISGNEVDRNFSVLAKLFKESEIRSVDELSEIVRNAPFVPKAICTNLFYIFDWKQFIMNKFAKTPLEHHSFYHSFQFTSEGGQAKFRAKLYPQDTEYGPETGIQLIKSGTEFEAVGPAILFYSITKHHINKYHEISTEHPHHVPSGGRESCDKVCPSADLSPL